MTTTDSAVRARVDSIAVQLNQPRGVVAWALYRTAQDAEQRDRDSAATAAKTLSFLVTASDTPNTEITKYVRSVTKYVRSVTKYVRSYQEWKRIAASYRKYCREISGE
jgi:hypothetical protein